MSSQLCNADRALVGVLQVLNKKQGGPFMPGVVFAPAPYTYRCPYGSRYGRRQEEMS